MSSFGRYWTCARRRWQHDRMGKGVPNSTTQVTALCACDVSGMASILKGGTYLISTLRRLDRTLRWRHNRRRGPAGEIPVMRFTIVVLSALTSLTGCVAPTTIQRPVSPEQIVREEANQREYVVRANLEQERRLYGLAYPMLRDARSLCPSTAPRLGFRVSTLGSYQRVWHSAAAAAGISDSLTVTSVADESPAAAARIAPGDRIVALETRAVLAGATAAKEFAEQLARTLASGNGQAQIGVVREGTRRDVILVADTLCDYDVHIVADQSLNAFADGRAVYVHTGMMLMMTDEELATVLSHEIAHNAMKHIQAQLQNASAGAFFGALLDVLAATQGVNTGGEFTSQFGRLAALTFSQDFEREADYVGMYILAAANRPLDRAPNLWRRMAMASPGSIKFASSHPTSVERYIRLEHAAGEIAEKRAAGIALRPETKNAQPAQRSVLARADGPGPRSAAPPPAVSPAPSPTVTAAPPPTVVRPKSEPQTTLNTAAAVPSSRAPNAPRTFVGSKADGVFFTSDCTRASELLAANRREFATEAVARAAGYRASRIPGCNGLPDSAQLSPLPSATSAPFAGSRVDQVYYLSTCPAALELASVNRRSFRNEQDALQAGYRRSRIPGC
jgi:beta-barrel assembly-enhancing protease